MRVYRDAPSSNMLWMCIKVLGDITLKHAVKLLNDRKLEQARFMLKQCEKFTDPIAGSNWSKRSEWCVIRKNMHKNLALFFQH